MKLKHFLLDRLLTKNLKITDYTPRPFGAKVPGMDRGIGIVKGSCMPASVQGLNRNMHTTSEHPKD